MIGFEYRIYRRDGSIIWVRENSRAVVDDNGVLLYYEGILQDITERKRIENDLRRQLEELRIEIDHQKLEWNKMWPALPRVAIFKKFGRRSPRSISTSFGNKGQRKGRMPRHWMR